MFGPKEVFKHYFEEMEKKVENKKRLQFLSQDGVVALITVLIVAALALLIGMSINLLAINEAKMALQKSHSSKSYYLANLCAEETFMRLKEDSNYQGNETMSIGDGNCTILPIEGSWTVKVSAVFFGQTKKMEIKVSQINPFLIINSWQEVGDF